MFNLVAPYRYLLPILYLSVTDIANPDLFACVSRTWISFDIGHFYEEHCQPSSESAWPASPPPKKNRPPHYWGRDGSTQFAQGLPDRCASSTMCRLCRLEPLVCIVQVFQFISEFHKSFSWLVFHLVYSYQ